MVAQSSHRSWVLLAGLVLLTARQTAAHAECEVALPTSPYRFAQEFTAQNVTVKQVAVLCPKAPKFPVVETTIDIVHAAFMNGTLTCTELVNIYVDRIHAYDQTTGLNSIQRMNPALSAEALVLDAALLLIRAGIVTMPSLFCVPVIVKDNYNTVGMVTTNGAAVLVDAMPTRDSTMVQQLKNAGALILAKTTMSEWAFSYESKGSAYGVSRNPYDLNRYSGGSSGGTGAGIGANLGLIGLGSDTGGSIRVPASQQALIGLRPTQGFTSRAGIAPLRSDADTGGPIGRTVRDVAKLMTVLAGVQDPLDAITSYAANITVPNYEDYLLADGLAGMKFGILLDYVERADGDANFKALFYQTVANMTAAGATFVNFTVPGWKAVWNGTEQTRSFPNADGIPKPRNVTAGGSAVANFLVDGLYEQIRLCNPFKMDLETFLNDGSTTTAVTTLQQVLDSGLYHPTSYSSLYGGSLVNYTKAGFVDDFRYQGATCGCTDLAEDKCRMGLRKSMVDAMEAQDIDAIVYLSLSNPARVIGDRLAALNGNQQLSPYTGAPAITVPIGFVAYPGAGAAVSPAMPASIEILGKPFEENILIKAAYAVETLLKARMPPRGFGECGVTNLVVPSSRRSLIASDEAPQPKRNLIATKPAPEAKWARVENNQI